MRVFKMANWKEIYEVEGVVQKEPRESIKQLVPIFKENNIKKIAVLGCGTGRHVSYLAKQGFFVFGADNEEVALQIAQKSFGNDAQNIVLGTYDVKDIPHPNHHFDAVICYDVLQHGMLDDAKKAIKEINRILKPNGLFFLGVVSNEHTFCGAGREIETNTFIDMPGKPDGDVPHHFFTEEDVKQVLSGFEIIQINHNIGPSETTPNAINAEWLVLSRKPGDENEK